MAGQVSVEELKGADPYFVWLMRLARGDFLDETVETTRVKSPDSEIATELLLYLFDRDFTVSDEFPDDKNRLTHGMELRGKYADEVSGESQKDKRERDRIWKSIHGKACCLEVILAMCFRLDEMVNIDGCERALVPQFFRILMRNLGLDKFSDEDFDENQEAVKKYWKEQIDLLLDRNYGIDGSGGGLFPILSDKNQKGSSLWIQMNNWLMEHLDDEGLFRE